MASLIESSTALHLYLAEPTLTAARRLDSDLPRERVVEITEFTRGTFSIDVSVQFSMANSNVVLGGLSEPHLFRGITGLSTPEDTPALLESPPSASDNAIAQLLRFESFESDWDGNFAAKPSHASLRDAKEFIRALAPESAIPEPALHADGTAVLLLVRSDHYAELEFLGSKRIGYFARRGDEQWNEDFSFDGVVLPGGLRKVGLALER